MTEPTKEQLDTWRREAILFLSSQTLGEWEYEAKEHNIAVPLNEWIDDHVCGNAEIDRVSTYLAAKKSNFEEISNERKLSYKYYGESEQLKIEKKQLEQELQKTREHLEKAEKVARLSQHIFDEDEADIAMEYANKYFKDKQGDLK